MKEKVVNGLDGKPLYRIDKQGNPQIFAGQAKSGTWWGSPMDNERRLIELLEAKT